MTALLHLGQYDRCWSGLLCDHLSIATPDVFSPVSIARLSSGRDARATHALSDRGEESVQTRSPQLMSRRGKSPDNRTSRNRSGNWDCKAIVKIEKGRIHREYNPLILIGNHCESFHSKCRN